MEPKYFGGGVEDGELATLYVEGLPCDVTKREVSHIFRHYKGFKDIRIIPKEDKTTRKTFILCFVDFVTRDEAGAAMRDLQGYKMDLELPEQRGLTIYFARTGKLFKNWKKRIHSGQRRRKNKMEEMTKKRRMEKKKKEKR